MMVPFSRMYPACQRVLYAGFLSASQAGRSSIHSCLDSGDVSHSGLLFVAVVVDVEVVEALLLAAGISLRVVRMNDERAGSVACCVVCGPGTCTLQCYYVERRRGAAASRRRANCENSLHLD